MAATAKLPAAYLNGVRSIYRLLKLAGSPGGWHSFEIGERLYSKRDYLLAQKNVRCVQEPEAEAVKVQEIKKSKSEDEGRNPIYGRQLCRISQSVR